MNDQQPVLPEPTAQQKRDMKYYSEANVAALPPAGWYPNPFGEQGMETYWNGEEWHQYTTRPVFQPVPAVYASVKQSRDKAQYTRQQQGHSLTLHILLCFVFVGWVTLPYYSISPNHYWHA